MPNQTKKMGVMSVDSLFLKLKGNFKDIIICVLLLIVLGEGIYGYFYQSRYYVDERRIGAYIDSLDFIIREGGGFRFVEAKEYISPNDTTIIHLAQELKTPERMYDFARKYVKYTPLTYEENLYASHVLESKQSNCAGQSNFLCSLLRAHGASSQKCHVVYGQITKNGLEGNHAWVELFWRDNWIILDPTPQTVYRKFGGWRKDDFYRTYQVVPVFEYNDTYTQFHRF